MNRRWAWCCAVAVAAILSSMPLRSAVPQGGGTLENVLKQMDTQAGDFKSLTADMDRTKVTVVVNDKSTESGHISVRRDDKMLIEVTQPDVRTILRNGDIFYIYNPKIHRVEEYNMGKKKSLVDQFLLLGFGTSGSSLKESYTISMQGEETLDGHKVVRLELLPKTDDVRKQLSKIQLWLDESTWLPLQQQFFETGSGDYFIIHYRNMARNARIPDNDFKPHWPHGTTVVQPQS
ncbi:MAG TPA: outer membrane lipoprotein carrier protein LolA [Candidatus Acidoferrales bacterium]|jgi:outer membrane lipoprotein-sorting protein|nr:outer membrane lipoprotein carrier protein LolA [Candidatus Acidoferrales bacterium]